jgi:hypothetical protein
MLEHVDLDVLPMFSQRLMLIADRDRAKAADSF